MDSLDFEWFGTRVHVTSDSVPFQRHLDALLGGLNRGAAGSDLDFTFHFKHPEGPLALGPRGVLRLDPEIPEAHAISLLEEELLSATGEFFVLHGAALVRDGRALLISAPSGFGKTTLTVHLALRGFRLLTDDLVAIDRAQGKVVPCPRALGLAPWTRESLPGDTVDRAREAAQMVRKDGEWLVDPVRFLGPPGSPAVPGLVVILRDPDSWERARRFPLVRVRFVRGRGPSPAELASLAGVETIVSRPDSPDTYDIRIADSTALSEFLREHREDIVSILKCPGATPRFDGKPLVRSLGSFEASLELSQEMVNRCPGSRLEDEFRGREAFLVAELAGALREARCCAIVPGRLEETIKLFEERFREACR